MLTYKKYMIIGDKMTHQTPTSWRKMVQKQMGEIPDTFWKAFVECEEEYIEVANQEAEEGGIGAGLRYLVERLEILLKMVRAYQASGPRIPERQAEHLDDLLVTLPPDTRCTALTKIVSRLLGKEEDVRQFRQEILGSKLLSDEDVVNWVETHKAIGAHEIPLRIESVGWVFDTVFTNKEGALHRLKTLSGVIAERGFWSEGEAGYFILTGIAPPIRPVITKANIASDFKRITIEVFPHVPGAVVERLYLEARDMLVKQGGWKPNTKKINEKHCSLAVFAAEQTDSWSVRLQKWNKAHPEWQYRATARSTFARDCRVAYERLTGCKLRDESRTHFLHTLR
jgi:hypothetical protein